MKSSASEPGLRLKQSECLFVFPKVILIQHETTTSRLWLSTFYILGKQVGSRFGQMGSKIQER